MTWDSQNRMASCQFNGTTSTFTYGADGLRRRMVTGTNTTDYLLDGQNVVREIKNGVVNATYLNGPRGPEYKRDQNGAVQWYLYDGVGSVVGLVDESGNVTNSRKYDVYGAPRNAQTGSAHCFVGGLGHTSDAETGLIYMRARHYDPATGRFVNRDPGMNGPNWYLYCHDDPVGYSDATGQREDKSPDDTKRATLFLEALALLAAIQVMAEKAGESPAFANIFLSWWLFMGAIGVLEAVDSFTGSRFGDIAAGTVAVAVLTGAFAAVVGDPITKVTSFEAGYGAMLLATAAVLDMEYQMLP